MASKSRLVVVIASLGRPDDIGDFLHELERQTRRPDGLVLSVTEEADLPSDLKPGMAEIVIGSKGLCAQRNRGLAHIGTDYDYVAFFDDDYLPTVKTIENICAFLDANPEIVGMEGFLIADGINGPGIGRQDALDLIAGYVEPTGDAVNEVEERHDLYGCNMIYRVSAIEDARFDEVLPAYGWLEDVDFSNQLLARGRLVKTNAFAGVHRGTKRSRSPGKKLGYSQISNPIYLLRKGTMSRSDAYVQIARNLVANHAKIFTPEPWVDRKGRAAGNWRGLSDLVRGKINPGNISNL